MSQRTFNWPPSGSSSTGITQFKRNGITVDVTEDTATPANNLPLPVKLTSVTGDINITAGDLNVQLSDQGANPDVTRIGDGTNRLGITASNEAKTSDATAATKLDTVNTNLGTVNTNLGTISTQQLGVFSAANSSTTLLLANGVFTGTAVEIKDFSAISVAVASDRNSATNGLSMQFSSDGVNWDHSHNFTVTAPGVSYTQSAESRYFRIVYTNTNSAQTFFRLVTILKRNETSPSRYTVEQTLTGTQLADVTKSVIWGLTTGGGGGYVQVKVNPSGALVADVTGTVTANQGGTWNINNVSGTVSLPTGASTAALQQSTEVLVGPVTETAPATDIASSGLNGRLQRIAQRLTSLIGLVPTSLGQKTMADSFAVTIASNQSQLPATQGRDKVTQLYNDYSVTSVLTSAYVQLTASTSALVNRIEIFDSSGETLILAVGAAASEVDQLFIFPGGNGPVDLKIPAGSRISVKAKTADATIGYLAINLYS